MHSLGERKTDAVSLSEYKKEHQTALQDYFLPKEQREFTSLPLKKIYSPLVSDSAKHIVILKDGEIIGYFSLEDGEKLRKYSKNNSARLLTSFSLNFNQQGKGFAKSALLALPEYISSNFPEISEIVLGVNKRNIPAYNLYIKTGFVDRDETLIGKKGPQHILHLDI